MQQKLITLTSFTLRGLMFDFSETHFVGVNDDSGLPARGKSASGLHFNDDSRQSIKPPFRNFYIR